MDDSKGDQTLTKAHTLVKYLTPILIRDENGPVKRQLMKSGLEEEESGFPTPAVIPGLIGSSPPCQDRAYSREEMVEILDCIFPTREWTETDLKVWQQKISPHPARRPDVLNLLENLDMRLKQQQVRSSGISPIRQFLFSQAIDEAIREVTIDSAERGLLLLRVRDEMQMTIAAHQLLYETGVRYGEKKAAEGEVIIHELQDKIKAQREKNASIESRRQEMKKITDFSHRSSTEEKKAWTKRRADELLMIKRSNQQLKMLLDSVSKF